MSSLMMLSNKFFMEASKQERGLMKKSAIEIVPPPPIARAAIKNENLRLQSDEKVLAITIIDV